MSDQTSDTVNVPIRNFPGYWMRAASQAAISLLSEQLAGLGVRLTEASILVAIQSNPKCRQSQIVQALHISSANLTPMLHQLEKRHLIQRKPLDGRTNALTLTKKGDEIATECLVRMKEHEERLTELLAPIKVEDFRAAMKRVASAMGS